MPNIKTYVFLDVETTGLIMQNAIPDITEISLVAVARNNILEAKENDRLPRVLNKLLLTMNTKKKIPKKVEDMTHLSNAKLRYSVSMDKNVCGTIGRFLNLFEKPICMVAHNGFRFDFPLVNRNLELHETTLSSEVLCIDSIQMFREYFEKQKLESKGNIDPQPVRKSTSVCDQDLEDLLNDDWEQVLIQDQDEDVIKNVEVPRREVPGNSHDTNSVSSKKYPKTPERTITNGKSPVKSPKLFSAPNDLKLGTIHKFLVGESQHTLHSAEGDTLSLLQCACKINDFFVAWTDDKAVKLNEIRRI